MHEHGPDELYGPVRGTQAWWRGLGAPPDSAEAAAPVQALPRRKRSRSGQNAKSIRTELVQRIRQEIAAGAYDTEEKWEAALDRLLNRLESAG